MRLLGLLFCLLFSAISSARGEQSDQGLAMVATGMELNRLSVRITEIDHDLTQVVFGDPIPTESICIKYRLDDQPGEACYDDDLWKIPNLIIPVATIKVTIHTDGGFCYWSIVQIVRYGRMSNSSLHICHNGNGKWNVYD